MSESQQHRLADVARALAQPSADPNDVATALGLTLAQLALAASDRHTQEALDALHQLYFACASLSVARTRAEAAAQLERLVRDAATLEATPDQVRRLLIDVLKLAEARPRVRVSTASDDDALPPLNEHDEAALRQALERMALQRDEADGPEEQR